MKKLVAIEFVVDESSRQLELGEKYSHFQDPETGKFYRPSPGFTVKSDEDLDHMFIEVPAE